MKSDFRSFSRILFVYNLMIECSKKCKENYPKKRLLNKGIKKPRVKSKHKLYVSANHLSNNWPRSKSRCQPCLSGKPDEMQGGGGHPYDGLASHSGGSTSNDTSSCYLP